MCSVHAMKVYVMKMNEPENEWTRAIFYMYEYG